MKLCRTTIHLGALMIALLPLLSRPTMASEPFVGTPQRVGDINHDGKVDGDDVGFLNDVLYVGRYAPPTAVDTMDINGDGLVNSDDLLELTAGVRERRLPVFRADPALHPLIIPRAVETAWWQRPETRLRENLQSELQGYKRAVEESIRKGSPERDAFVDVEKIIREWDTAVQHGFLGGAAAEICKVTPSLQGVTDLHDSETLKWLKEPAEGRQYLESCARRLDEVPHRIQGRYTDRSCPDLAYGISYDYKIQRDHGQIKIQIPVHIEFDKKLPPSEARRFLDTWSVGMICAKDFWSRYGVNFELEYVDATKAETIVVHPGEGPGNSGNFYMINDTVRSSCTWITHEFGHWLGLADEYEPTGHKCPERPTQDLDSVMSTGGVDSASSSIRWYPRHLERIFGQVCGPYPKPKP